jgi:hypothetical protein
MEFLIGAWHPNLYVSQKPRGLSFSSKITPDWPLCAAARHVLSPILRLNGPEKHDLFGWKTVFETIRPDDGLMISDQDIHLW